MVLNALTIDFEDWFCVANLSQQIKFKDWNKCESRILKNTSRILELLDKYDIKATFFVLGWLAERFPDIIKQLDMNGHEIASHGYSHISVNNMTKSEFEIDLKKAIEIKKNIINKEILGYRSPSFSVNANTSWVFDVLVTNGIKYDSSVFPLSFHPDYGFPGSPTSKYFPRDTLMELPLNVSEFLGMKIPFGGGGYFRLYPYFITNYLMKSFNKRGRPFIFYLHPWEIDNEQPRVKTALFRAFRHYYNLKNTFEKFERVVKNYKFSTMKQVFCKTFNSVS